ncbi:MAG TPA: phosphoglycerate kinase [Polyangia bacterium]
MSRRTLPQLEIEGRRVLVRTDFDVPLTPARGVADPAAIAHALPTIRHIIERGGRAILISHLDDPGGRPRPEQSLEPVGATLAELLGQEVVLADEPAGDGARKVISDLRSGGVALLENLRFSPGEEANEERFARTVASYGDVFVNDAFAVCHKPHASMIGVPRHVSQRGMGLELAEEVTAFDRMLGEVERPFVVVMGGDRFGDRMPALDALIDRADAFFFGGTVANTFLRARGGNLGRSLFDDDRLPWARAFLTKATSRDIAVHLPRDLVVAAGTRSPQGRVVAANRVPEDQAALDIGPDSAAAFAETIAQARTVFWNGPMGVFEAEPFANGTFAIARAIASTRGALAIAAGRSTAAAVRRSGMQDRLTPVTPAGAAALEYLQNRRLPGLTALES